MVLRSPCPKCREPMLAGVTKCTRCGYRPTPWEVRNSRRMAVLKTLFVIALIVVIFLVIRNN